MRRKRKQKQIPAYAFGTSGAGMAEGIGQGVAGMFDQFGNKSTAQTTGQAVKQSITDINNRTMEGMKVGSQFGPWGALIGGAIGTTVGLVGRKGGVTQTAGFTEDDESSLGTGLIGAFGNKKIRKEIAASKNNVANNRVAVASTADIQSDWDAMYDDNIDTFADGGQGASLAYVDDGELIQTPEGNISKVPEQGQATDSNLVNLPYGSRILSDKLKVPGTKKTFAQVGEEMMTKRKSKGTDIYAQNSAKLNEMNNNMIHDQLFEMQESIKSKRGIKNKTKAFATGGPVVETPWSRYADMQSGVQPQLAPLNAASMVQPLSLSSKLPQMNTTNPSSTKGFNWMDMAQNVGNDIATLTPVISNLGSKPEASVAPVQNPYADTISRTMRKRRYDINPTIEALKSNRAVSDYNARQVNTNTGANLAYRLQTAAALNNSISDLYSQASNIQNQYDADYASTLNSLGQQYVGATNMARDINARNRAANRNIRRAGLSQLSEFAQNKQLMKNQKGRDAQMLPLYRRFLESGFTEEDLSRFLNQN